jgi:UPF0755 protein
MKNFDKQTTTPKNRQRKASGLRTTMVSLTIVTGLAIAGILAFIWFSLSHVEQAKLNNAEPVTINIEKGSSLYSVKKQLEKYTEIHSTSFKIWARFNRNYNKVQAGLYEIPPNTGFVEALSIMLDGTVKQFSLTLIEGQTWAQWYDLISTNGDLSQDLGESKSIYARLVSPDSFCANQYNSIEGCLLPDTYYFTHNASAFSLVERAYSAMQATLDASWNNRFADIPIQTPYDLLILASIIEKETAINDEREEIAGVFANRLNQNMRLQTDPTVIYGIGEAYDGNITRKHLRTPTPYNTYVIKGLPITPIAMPGGASILAATRPALTDSLYFVATGNGGHYFSTNLAEHNAAVRRYLDVLKQRRQSN